MAKRTAKTNMGGTDAVAGGEDVGVISPRSLIEAATSAIESGCLRQEWSPHPLPRERSRPS